LGSSLVGLAALGPPYRSLLHSIRTNPSFDT
jgi:hypothetical protein